MWQDIQYAFRNLWKTPGFLAVSVATLALGIGANTAMFGVVKAVLLASLPYPHPAQLVQLWDQGKNGHLSHVSRLNFQDWRAQNHSLAALAYGYADVVTATGLPAPERLPAAFISADYFRVFAVSPEWGRATLASDHQAGAEPVAVISHALWQRQFGADHAALDRTIHIAGTAFRIVGVMPRGFDFPEHADAWVPIKLIPDTSTRSAHNYLVWGRVRNAFALRAAQADMDHIAVSLGRQYPEDKDRGIRVVSLYEQIVGPVRPALLTLLVAVGFVLLIACVNIANLQLARGSTRVKEMALRSALGARRGRLIAQLLTESMLVAVLGGAAGFVLAWWATSLLRAAVPPDIPRLENIHIDGAVFAFTLGVSLLAGLLFGVLPALSGSQVNVTEALKEGAGKSTVGAGHRRTGNFLVVAEISLAMVLLVGAGLLIETFRNLEHVDPGFATTGVLTAQLAWPSDTANPENDSRVAASTGRMLDRIRQIPGVSAAAVTNALPIQDGRPSDGCFAIAGRPYPADVNACPDAGYVSVTRDYFRVLGIPLEKGRLLRADEERTGVAQSAVVNRAFTAEFFPSEDPIGKTIQFLGMEMHPEPLRIVGVVGDVRSADLAQPARSEVYVDAFQNPGRLGEVTLVVRAQANAVPAITAAIGSVSREMPVDFKPIDRVLAQSVARQAFQMMLLAIFAGLALALATVGIYGVQSYTVTRRTNELGIRLALGADRRSLVTLVLREGLTFTAFGLLAGMGAALLLTRALASLLYGVSATDPLVIGAVALLLTVVSVLACYLPARRAAATDPMTALRYE